MPVKVFISYKVQDNERNLWVENLYQDLRANGIDAILDKYEVPPGQSFSDYMTKGIREADYVLFIITPAAAEAVESGFGALAFEMQIANARRINKDRNFSIIPIFREGVETSTYLSDHRYIDFRNDEEYQNNLNGLIKWLKGRVKPPALITEPEHQTNYYVIDSFADDVLTNLRRFRRINILGYASEDINYPDEWVKRGELGTLYFQRGYIEYTRSPESIFWDDPWKQHDNIFSWDLEYHEDKGVIALARYKHIGGYLNKVDGYYMGPFDQENIESLLRRVGKFRITGYIVSDISVIKESEREKIIKARYGTEEIIYISSRAILTFYERGVSHGSYYSWGLEWDDKIGVICTDFFESSDK